MSTPVKRFLVMLGGSVVSAAVLTVFLAPENAVMAIATFAVIMIGGATLSYVIGFLGTSWDDTAYTEYDEAGEAPEDHTAAAQTDAEEFQWMIREGIGVAIASLFGLLLLAVFMLEETRIASSPGFTTGNIETLTLIAVLAVALVVVGLWSWRGTPDDSGSTSRDTDDTRR
ncbi:hypothetical protein [Halostagnicola bangensis]